METDPLACDKTDEEIFGADNRRLLERVLKLYQYLGQTQPLISKEHPSHFFQEPGYRRDIEVAPDGSEGAIHSWHSPREPKLLSPEELFDKLKVLHSSLKEKALQNEEKTLLRDLATKKLEDAGIY